MSGPSILDTLATIAIAMTSLALLALAGLLLYRISLKRHPYTDCRRCQGTGERRSRLFAHSYGYCPTCSGTGQQLRLGVRLFNVR
jgi:hypothetical protein